MALSFQIELLPADEEDVHHYRADLDGGDRTFFLLLDESTRTIKLANSEGDPVNDLVMSIDSGDVVGTPPDESSADFTMVAAHLRSDLKKKGVVPTRIRKFFG